MITRRDALRFVAAMPAVVPALAMSAKDAAAELDKALANVPAKTERDSVLDPVGFAERLNGIDFGFNGFCVAPEEEADLMRLFHELEQEVPELKTKPRARELYNELSDAAFDYAIESGWAGVRAGAAYENLRLALLGPTRICPECLSYFERHGMGPSREECTRCGGTGVVATPGVVAAR